MNCSWGHRQFIRYDLTYNATFRGTSYTRTEIVAATNVVPAVYYLNTNSTYFEMTTRKTTGQTTADELVNDADCQNVVLVCAAGNSNGKQEVKGGIDHDNQFTSGSFYYGSGYDDYYNRSGTPAYYERGRG